ncbi:M28 family peptidase [Clostridium sporogenes]|uniref:M28 family peptidase n=1 Tax=Clostridium botulinum TaxID=1491 RepID=A0A6M0SYN8_CLOBO|nr:M28 family peptidase [Clostridium sporogenes]NFA59810.1 M28 family peptidase [Clostridium botulinum]NFI72162.1 M28 family peptidase [Clostridium sporogenes]NFL72583.1 M28 family peptidase [Clostridium sporogenes]NFM23700.1 M28 family peptidase [Clostridium sporogenes]NFP60990.1 M28 family peptidase [Clostridium sporogenes]
MKSTESKDKTATSEQSSKSTQDKETVKFTTTKEVVNTLCSDEFEGRLVGSKGNKKAEEYVSKIFKDIGLSPLFNDSYYQKYYQSIIIDSKENDKISNKLILANNVVGVIKGKDSKKAVVISAHFDHAGYEDGKLIRGALDNASGMSALIKVANDLKKKSAEKSFDMDIVICAFNGEEEGLGGSKDFVHEVPKLYDNLYNINIDCIGAKKGGKLALKNKSKVSDKLYASMKTTLKKHNIEFRDTDVRGTSDHKSFENESIPNFFFAQENIEDLIHKPTDTPDTLNYEQIDKIANAVVDFVETNNGVTFN